MESQNKLQAVIDITNSLKGCPDDLVPIVCIHVCGVIEGFNLRDAMVKNQPPKRPAK